jgi:hypothetical protein
MQYVQGLFVSGLKTRKLYLPKSTKIKQCVHGLPSTKKNTSRGLKDASLVQSDISLWLKTIESRLDPQQYRVPFHSLLIPGKRSWDISHDQGTGETFDVVSVRFSVSLYAASIILLCF